MASFRQDLYFGAEPRLHALRLGPHEDAFTRLLVHPDDGMSLEHPALIAFLEVLAHRIEVVCLEPCALAHLRLPDRLAYLRDCLTAIDSRWPRRLPLILVGHGRGGALALALAGSAEARGIAALAPMIESTPEIDALDLASRIDHACIPFFAAFPSAESAAPVRTALERHPQTTLILFPGDGSAALSRPVATFVAEWSLATSSS